MASLICHKEILVSGVLYSFDKLIKKAYRPKQQYLSSINIKLETESPVSHALPAPSLISKISFSSSGIHTLWNINVNHI